MPDVPQNETTQLLRAWAGGDEDALRRLTPRVYRELRRIAGHYMKHENPGQTIQATALVHEAYLRLVDVEAVDLQDRVHFLAVAAQIMRRILVDRARRRASAKRGGVAARVDLDAVPDLAASRGNQIVALDQALDSLAKIYPRQAQVVELRYFGGLSVDDTAAVMKVSRDTVLRDWRLARACLLAELKQT
jgi:RNA polymerase sigma factor (TIGR02999 family)